MKKLIFITCLALLLAMPQVGFAIQEQLPDSLLERYSEEFRTDFENAPVSQRILFDALTKRADSVKSIDKSRYLSDLNAALLIAEAMKNDSLIASTYFKLGNYYQEYSGYDSSAIYLTLALEKSRLLDDKHLLVDALTFLGVAQAFQQKADQAMTTLQEAAEEARKLPDGMENELEIAMEMAYVMIDTRFFDRAESILKDALKRSPFPQTSQINRRLLNTLGYVYMDTERPDSAIQYLRASIEGLPEEGFETRYGAYYTNMGISYQRKGEYKAAEQFFLKSLALSKQIQSLPYEGIDIANLGTNYLLMDRPDLTLKYTIPGIELAKKIGDPLTLRQCYSLTSEAYADLKNFEKAYEYHEKVVPLLDSLLSHEKYTALANLEAKYESEKKAREIALQNEQLTAQEAKLAEAATFRNALIGGALLLIVVIGLIARNARLKSRSLKEKEYLLKEIHHRVKNNLQVISSLLNMQSREADDPGMLDVIKEGQSRVKAMSLIHQKLYQTDNLSEIDFAEYSQQLIDQLSTLYKRDGLELQKTIDAKDIRLDIDTAIPLGLILNELISNSFKYAFNEMEKGELQISLERTSKEDLKLVVSDNGSGLPGNVDLNTVKSLGLKLVNILTKQLKGSMNFSSENGARFEIQFKDLRMSA